jgi:hypothetical protein
MRLAVCSRRQLTAAANEEKEEKEKAQQQIGCAAISLGPAPAQTRVDALPHDFPTTFPHDFPTTYAAGCVLPQAADSRRQ